MNTPYDRLKEQLDALPGEADPGIDLWPRLRPRLHPRRRLARTRRVLRLASLAACLALLLWARSQWQRPDPALTLLGSDSVWNQLQGVRDLGTRGALGASERAALCELFLRTEHDHARLASLALLRRGGRGEDLAALVPAFGEQRSAVVQLELLSDLGVGLAGDTAQPLRAALASGMLLPEVREAVRQRLGEGAN